MTPLSQQHCKPVDGQAPMATEAITTHLALVSGWALVNGAIEKAFSSVNCSLNQKNPINAIRKVPTPDQMA